MPKRAHTPNVSHPVGALVSRTNRALRTVGLWLDLGTTSEPLYNYTMTGSAWLHLGASAAVWLLLPLGVGVVRLLHHELK